MPVSRSGSKAWLAHELVPLADRMLYMRYLRLVLLAVVVVVAGFDVGHVAPTTHDVWAPIFGYIACAAGGELAWRLWPGRALWLFGSLVVADAAFLVYVNYATGAAASPLRLLLLVHLSAAALLASYRTGLKLVVWYVLLLTVQLHLQRASAASTAWPHLPGGDYAQLAYFSAILALVAFATSTLSAVNERELRRRRFDLEALAAFATELEHAETIEAVAKQTVDSVAENFALDRVVLVGLSPRLHLLAGRGHTESAATGEASPSGLVAAAAARHETLLRAQLDDVDDRWLADLLPEAHNVGATALFAEGGCVAVLVFEHGIRRGSRVERRLVSIVERFAAHAALALRNASLLAQVQKAAATDALTGLANRREFEAALEREVARAVRTGQPVGLVMLDIDHFKTLNDTYGHQAGDDVLAQVADALRATCRVTDVPTRFGGEEFAVLLPACGPEEAALSATRLWAAIGDAATVVPITVSAGYACFPAHGGSGRALIEAADQALYEAKRTGRNRVVGCSRVSAAAPSQEQARHRR